MNFLNPKNTIDFDKESHTYTKNGVKYISVSTLVKKYSQEFDPTGEILVNKAAKLGIPPEELRKQWDFIRDSACDQGNSLHSQAEYWVNTGKVKQGDYADVVKQIKQIPFKGPLRSETLLFSERLKIAGTVDLLEDLGGKCFGLWDFKTNKKLNEKSFFDRKKWKFSFMKPPVPWLMDCNKIHYSLQLEIYSILLEENGYNVTTKTLIYVPPKTRIIELHPIKPLKKEAWAIIKHYNWDLDL